MMTLTSSVIFQIRDDAIVARSHRLSGPVYTPIRSRADYDAVIALANGAPIMCSSSIDFADQETDNEQTLQLVEELFPDRFYRSDEEMNHDG